VKEKTPVHSGRVPQTTEQLPSFHDIPEVVIKASSGQVSGGPAGPPQREGSSGGIIPPPLPLTGFGAPEGNCDDSNTDS
jgi:hypothetical protein